MVQLTKKAACALLAGIVVTVTSIPLSLPVGAAKVTSETLEDLLSTIETEGSYGWYLRQNNIFETVGEEIQLLTSDSQAEPAEDDGNLLEKKFTWEVDLPQAGRYYLRFVYTPDIASVAELSCSLYVNGETPYAELSGFCLSREYQDASETIEDIYGNEIHPEQIAVSHQITNYAFDYVGSYQEPLSVCLGSGTNVVTVVDESMVAGVEALILQPVGNILSYEDYCENHKSADTYTGEPLFIEAEDADYKSTTTLYPISDKSSAGISPVQNGRVLLNVLGGYRWSTAGDYASWVVTVPEDGLYSIAIKTKQNVRNGQNSSRILMINGVIPFQEAMTIKTEFSNKWNMQVLGNEEERWLVFLEKGENEIRLQATLGEQDTVLRVIDNCVQQLNQIHRKLLILIGASPDPLRDYDLDQLVPEQFEKMAQQADRLETCADWIAEFSGGENSGTALLRSMIRKLREMVDDPDVVAENFSYFKTTIGSIGTWLAEAKEQPLEVDYLVVGAGEELPKANAPFFVQFWFDVKEFVHTFITDYRSIGQLEQKESSEESIRVWIASGRDQAQLIRGMISDKFVSQYGIGVNLELVDAGALLPATVAGIGPDVVMSAGDVFNFAMRNALYDLKSFDDFDEVMQRFHKTMIIPVTYRDGVYGIPEAMNFSVLFYRHDILDELGLEVPETWDDIIEMTTALTKSNMEIGLPAGSGTFLLFLRQNNIEIYKDEGIRCELDSAESIEIMKKYTNFFTNYGLPLSYDLLNRFRSGEMPIAVADFSFFSSLQVAAPEIRGQWSMTLLPGFRDETGEVNHTSLAGCSAAVIMRDADNKDACWEYLKWWTSADSQVQFGKEIESLLGPSARYSSANLEAFARSSWSKDDMKVLQLQMQSLDAIEPVPGGYFLSRHLDNAFRNVVYKGKKPMDVMFDYVFKINQELTEKRKEFGLPTSSY